MNTKKKVYGIESFEKKYGKLTLARFLTAWRKSEKFSQKEFAIKLGISPANLCDIEKGRKGLSIYKASEIAKIIGYSPTVLVQLALQELVTSSGLKYTVELKMHAA
jgi:transcriptional regulator with XRE-family HTH domain